MSVIRCRQCGHETSAHEVRSGRFQCPSCDWTEVLSAVRPALPEGGADEDAAHAAIEELAVMSGESPEGEEHLMDDDGIQEHEIGDEHDHDHDHEHHDEHHDEHDHEHGGEHHDGHDHAGEHDVASETPDGPEEPVLTDEAVAGRVDGRGHATVTPLEADVADLLALDGPSFIGWCAGIFGRFGYDVCAPQDPAERDCDLLLRWGEDAVLVECRRVEADEAILRGECQRLVGAMVGHGARRGIVVTTGAFSEGARAYVDRLSGLRVDLIDGRELGETLDAIHHSPLRKWWPEAA